jgi:Protein of unknown function (DUF1573)
MKRWIALIVLVIGLSGAATLMTQIGTNSEAGPTLHAVNAGTGPRPKVVIEAPLLYDFGTMSQHRKNSHVWELKNAGDADLEIWLEESTCSCTIGKLAVTAEGERALKPHVRVKPNETTPIAVDWDTKQFPNPSYSQSVKIGTTDPARPTFTLTVKGTVYPPVQVYPPEMINLPAISNEEVSRTAVAVYSMDMPNMKVTKVSTGRPDFFKATHAQMTDAERKQLHVLGGGHRVEVEIKPGLPLGQFADTLLIETDHPLQKEIKVSIRGYATGPISVVPAKLSLRANGAVGATTSMSVHVRGGEPVKFEVAQKPGKHVNITITPYSGEKQKGRWRLTVAVPPGTPAMRMDNDLILHTDHPRASEIKIPADIIVTNSSSG